MPLKDDPVSTAIKNAIGTKRRGRKKVIAMIQRTHPHYSSSRVRRVYEQQGYTLYSKCRKRRQQTKANPAFIPMQENHEWGIDFMHDVLVNSRQIRSLNIIDPFNRLCKVTHRATHYSSGNFFQFCGSILSMVFVVNRCMFSNTSLNQ
jgi:putative transposase